MSSIPAPLVAGDNFDAVLTAIASYNPQGNCPRPGMIKNIRSELRNGDDETLFVDRAEAEAVGHLSAGESRHGNVDTVTNSDRLFAREHTPSLLPSPADVSKLSVRETSISLNRKTQQLQANRVSSLSAGARYGQDLDQAKNPAPRLGRPSFPRSLAAHRQQHRRRRANARDTDNFHTAPMRRDSIANLRQTQTLVTQLPLGREVGRETTLSALLIRHAGTVVGDREANEVARFQARSGWQVVLIECDILGLDSNGGNAANPLRAHCEASS